MTPGQTKDLGFLTIVARRLGFDVTYHYRTLNDNDAKLIGVSWDDCPMIPVDDAIVWMSDMLDDYLDDFGVLAKCRPFDN